MPSRNRIVIMNSDSELICISSDEATSIDISSKKVQSNGELSSKKSVDVIPYYISREKSKNTSINKENSKTDSIKYSLPIVSTPKVSSTAKSESKDHKYIPFLSNYNASIRQCQVFDLSPVSSDSEFSVEVTKTKNDTNSFVSDAKRLKSIDSSIVSQCSDKIPPNSFDINRVKEIMLRDFLSECVSSKIAIADLNAIKPRLNVLYKNFRRMNEWFIDSDDLKSQLIEYRNQIKDNPQHVMQYFNLVFDLFENKMSQGDQENKIDRCVYLMDNLKAKIKQLEETEVDFDEEENSAYLQESFYKDKFCKVYKRWCKLIGKSYYQNRTIYQKIEYTQSKYTEFNNAINEAFRKKCKFPSYDLIDSVLRKCVETHKMKIALSDLEIEINKVFRTVGKIFQRRRIYETNDNLFYFLASKSDPADEDEQLNKKLKEYSKEAEQKFEAIFDYYTQKQYKLANGKVDDSDDNVADDEKEDSDSSSSESDQDFDDLNTNIEMSNSQDNDIIILE